MKLTEEQKKAIETQGSMAVIASAGTGKTTVLTQRFLHAHLQREMPLHQLLAFTFTEKASREMMARVLESDHLSYAQAPLLNISTIHSFCQRLLKQHGEVLGLRSDFEVYDEESHNVWVDIMIAKRALVGLDENSIANFIKCYGYQNLKKTMRFLIKMDVQHVTAQARTCLNLPTEIDVPHLNDFLKTVFDFQEELIQHKIKNQILSYDDLEVLTMRLLSDHPQILKKIQRQYKQILVDEYQDISPRQFFIIKKLFQSKYNELFIVGDPKQSIYGFRDADVRLFHETVQFIEQQGGTVIYLTQTFRTPKRLQAYFNKVFPLVLGSDEFREAHTEKEDPEAFLYAAPLPEESLNTAGLQDRYASDVATQIQHLVQKGTKPEEIAVLFYASLPISVYKQAINAKGIKTITQTENSLFDLPLTTVVWQIMKYLAGERDLVTQVGILRNEIFAFSEMFIDQIVKTEQKDFFVSQTVDLFSGHRDRDVYVRLTDWMKKWQELSPALFATELIQTIVNDIRPDLSAQEAFFIQNFIKILTSWQKEGLYYLKEITLQLKVMGVGDIGRYRSPAHPEGVHLMTVHAAKGLEFDHVFLVPGRGRNKIAPLCLLRENEGFIFKTHDAQVEKALQYELEEPELFQQTLVEKQDRENKELARLVYVALTRARKGLYFYIQEASQVLRKKLSSDPTNTKPITHYNDWLYWLACVIGHKEMASEYEHSLFEEKQLVLGDVIQEITETAIPSYTFNKIISPSVYTVTELEIFHQCQKRFQLRYINNLQPIKHLNLLSSFPDSRTKLKTRLRPSERGNLFHEILQYYDFNTGNNLKTVIDQALFNQHIIAADEAIQTECHLFMNRLKQDAFIKRVLFESREAKPEVEIFYNAGSFILSGQVDRLVTYARDDGRIENLIIDYKTHHTTSDDQRDVLMKQFSFQMSCYALALNHDLRQRQIETLILFTSVPTYRKLCHNLDSLNAFGEELNKIYDNIQHAIQSDTFYLTKDRGHCVSCPYFKDNYCGVKTGS